jgi:hypothetical protein
MFQTLSPGQLASVCGGITEEELRTWAASHAPKTYAGLKNKPMSQFTRADAERCVTEAHVDLLTRTVIRHRLDSLFPK